VWLEGNGQESSSTPEPRNTPPTGDRQQYPALIEIVFNKRFLLIRNKSSHSTGLIRLAMSNLAQKERDQDLVRRIRKGDHDAFEQLFRVYSDALCSFAADYVGDRVAEDIVQTVFCDLWERREEWPLSINVKAYLYRAVRNTALDHLDRRDIEQDWKDEEKERYKAEDRIAPVEALQHQEMSRAMKQAVEDLPERRRMIYRMARHHNMTYSEIATALDIAPKTVENQMGRALKTLRDHLKRFASLLQ
jgi:RNA polymerase sigma-70 factor (family 1)